MARHGRKSDDALRRALDEIHALREAPEAPEAREKLARALTHRSSFVVEAAAKVIADFELPGHADALEAAFARFADAGAHGDPGSKAKVALVAALVRLGIDAPEVYRRAVRLVQLEPAFGPPVDTAAPVRCAGAAGLAMARHLDAAVAAAELLADDQWDARAGAVRALLMCSREAAEPILRYKLRIGDPQPAVVGDCLRALLALDARTAMPLAAERLRDARADIAEQAALALGDSREDGAFAALAAYLAEEPPRDRARTALLAMGLLRRDEAVDFLIARVGDGDGATGLAAAEALGIYRHDERIRERVEAAARGRKDAELAREVKRLMRD